MYFLIDTCFQVLVRNKVIRIISPINSILMFPTKSFKTKELVKPTQIMMIEYSSIFYLFCYLRLQLSLNCKTLIYGLNLRSQKTKTDN